MLGILMCTGIALVINNHAILIQVKGVNDLTAREFFCLLCLTLGFKHVQ